jgi:hypothetical protein
MPMLGRTTAPPGHRAWRGAVNPMVTLITLADCETWLSGATEQTSHVDGGLNRCMQAYGIGGAGAPIGTWVHLPSTEHGARKLKLSHV